MLIGLKFFLFTGAVFALVSYRYYTPIPEDFQTPGLMRFKLGMTKLVGDACWLYSAATSTNVYKCRGRVHDKLMEYKHVLTPGLQHRDISVEGVRVRVYTPASLPASHAPAVVFYHGGAFLIGHIETYHSLISNLSVEANVKIFSVEYRLAPEHVFPSAYDDCLKVTKYLLSHADDHGIDATRVALMGSSAGANLAASVALSLRSNPTRPKTQILLCPWLHFVDFMTSSYQQVGDPGFLIATRESAQAAQLYLFGYIRDNVTELMLTNSHLSEGIRNNLQLLDYSTLPESFLPPTFKRPDSATHSKEPLPLEEQMLFIDRRVCPLCVDDVSGTPTAYIYTGHYDPVRDDGVWYAQRLRKAGVGVEHFHHRPSYHGIVFDLVGGGIPEAKELHQSLVKHLRKSL